MTSRSLSVLLSGALLFGCGPSNQAPAKKDSAEPAAGKASPAEPRGPGGLRSGGLLLPPAEHGGAVVRLEGCSASGTGDDADAKAFPVPAATRGPVGPEPFTVVATGSGVILAHELAHMCCRKAEVTATLVGTTVTVRETLAGPGCRCNCMSTVRAAVGLGPGAYTLIVETDRAGEVTVAHEQPITVAPLERDDPAPAGQPGGGVR